MDRKYVMILSCSNIDIDSNGGEVVVGDDDIRDNGHLDTHVFNIFHGDPHVKICITGGVSSAGGGDGGVKVALDSCEVCSGGKNIAFVVNVMVSYDYANLFWFYFMGSDYDYRKLLLYVCFQCVINKKYCICSLWPFLTHSLC